LVSRLRLGRVLLLLLLKFLVGLQAPQLGLLGRVPRF
jgi:hypothetical protein